MIFPRLYLLFPGSIFFLLLLEWNYARVCEKIEENWKYAKSRKYLSWFPLLVQCFLTIGDYKKPSSLAPRVSCSCQKLSLKNDNKHTTHLYLIKDFSWLAPVALIIKLLAAHHTQNRSDSVFLPPCKSEWKEKQKQKFLTFFSRRSPSNEKNSL